MGSSIAFAAALVALAVQFTSSNEQVHLGPTGNWTVDFAESMCVLSRQYGSGNDPIFLAIKPAPMGDGIRVGLLVKDKSIKVSRGKAKVGVDGLQPIDARYVKGPVKIEGMHVVAIDLKRSEAEYLNAAKSLQIAAAGYELSLRTPQMEAAMRVLASCEKDLLASWGMDPKVIDSIATLPAHPNGMVSLFSTDDYPSKAVMDKEQGIAGVRFWVGTDGKVSDCRVVESSGSEAIDRQTCRIIQTRARFEPARTEKGDPVATIAFQRIRWELP